MRASSSSGGEFLYSPDQVVTSVATEAVGPEPERMFGVGESSAPEQHRGVRECGAQMSDDPAGRGGRGLGGARHGDGQQVGHSRQHLGQRVGRRIRTEFDHVEPGPAQQVGGDSHGS